MKVLSYLKSISGSRTVSGIHNREPNSQPDKQTSEVTKRTGIVPGLWSGDFLFSAADVSHRSTMIREARRQWELGSIVNVMCHVAPPTQPDVCAWEGGVISKLTDAQWADLIKPGGRLNKAWLARLDEQAVHLGYLKQNGVEVLYRPFHEMNQGQFWWAGRRGPSGTAALYRLTHDYLTKVHKLTNLIWVWDMQDMSRDFADYNPGEKYWDVFAFDVYDRGFDKSWYDYILPIVGDKPMAIGECDKLPTAKMLDEQPRWCFFMSWAELTFEKNSDASIRELYRSTRLVHQRDLPDFRKR